MKIVVTGGGGYVGTRLIPRLLGRFPTARIVVYDNFSRNDFSLLTQIHVKNPASLEVIRGDLLDSRLIQTVTQSCNVVLHLAAVVRSPFNDEYPHIFDQVNHWGSAELAYAIEKNHVERAVYLSSGAIYGSGPEPFSHENDPMPVTSYGVSKLAGERQFQRLSDDTDILTLRSGTVYGMSPAMRFDTVTNRFLLNTLLNERLTVHGDGNQHRPLIHVDTLVDILESSIDKLSPGIYDVFEANYTINDVVEAIRAHQPGIETLGINQNQKLKDLTLQSDPRLEGFLVGKPSLRQRIGESLQSFPLWEPSDG